MTLVSNRSLERGLAVLDCFRPGTGLISHREIAERTGLPKPTVSRLLSTLRQKGYLVFDEVARGYRLGMPVLSLAWAFSLESELREALSPVITRVANETASILGFGTVHELDIVYLAACNGDPKRAERKVGPGMRAAMATTSVGRAYLAALPAKARDDMIGQLRRSPQWKPGLQTQIAQAILEVKQKGYCLLPYSDGHATAIGMAMPVRRTTCHAVSLSYATQAGAPRTVPSKVLKGLEQIKQAVDDFNRE